MNRGASLSVAILATALVAAGCAPRPVEVPAASPPSKASPPTATATSVEPPTDEASQASPTVSATPTPAVLIAAGDIAGCDSRGDEATARLVQGIDGTVATLGDNAYPSGSPSNFRDCYDPSWGAFKDRIRPAVGNHEYETSGASGYFAYFGAAAGDPGRGYYSYDLGAWHVVVLNSMCWEVGGCGRDDPQAQWLESDLEANPALCTLAYWHFPRYSSGPHGGSDFVKAYWDLLVQAGAEIVLTGHDHDYERFAPQDERGGADPDRGVREFVVGTGGFSHYTFPGAPAANSEAHDTRTYGVLVLRLHPERYEWEFVPVEGGTFTDRGEDLCHP